MANYVQCKACGYIMEENGVKDKCPACGLPKTIFVPYVNKISPRRKFLIDQHIHPIIVHFPQVFLTLVLFMPLLSLFVAEPWRTELLIVTKLAILVLPFSVLGGLLTGFFDGKLRFKKLSPPALVSKAVVGGVLQILSVIILGLYLAYGFTGFAFWLIILFSAISMGCAIYLGRLGSSLFNAILPG